MTPRGLSSFLRKRRRVASAQSLQTVVLDSEPVRFGGRPLGPLAFLALERGFIMHKDLKRLFATLLVAIVAVFALAACSGGSSTTPSGSEPAGSEAAAEDVTVRVASLKGPTSIGLAELMQRADAGETDQSYDFQMFAAADELNPLVIKGEVDIALVPANVAAILFNKTEGGVTVVDINTLGVLYCVAADDSIQSVADLAGRTVVLTGKGQTPEFVVNYLLEQAGIADQVTLEYKDEPTEVVAALSADPNAIGILPQPFVTAACAKNEALSVRFGLTEAWAEVAPEGSQMVTGVTVVRTEFLQEHPEAVAQFMLDQANSVQMVNEDPQTYGQVVADLGIVDAAPIATAAIPGCNLVCITGAEMQAALEGYYGVLFDADPSSLGGALPTAEFYYVA